MGDASFAFSCRASAKIAVWLLVFIGGIVRLDRKSLPLELLTYHYRIVHGVRIGLAFILTFLLIRLLAVPEGTAADHPVVVMGPISF